MSLFGKLIDKKEKTKNLSSDAFSPYDIGTAFASLATCAAIKDSTGFYMAIVDNDPDDNSTTFFCGGGDLINKALENGHPVSVEKYLLTGVPRDIAVLLTKLSYKSKESMEVRVDGSIDVPRMLDAMRKGILKAGRKPYTCDLKDYIVPNTNRKHIDLTVCDD